MTGDRQLWSLGGLSAVATIVVLLGATGGGADITRAAEAALGVRKAPAAAVEAKDASSASASADDAASAGSSSDASEALSAADTTAASDTSSSADDGSGGTAGTGGTGGTGDTAATTPARVASNIKHVFVITLGGQGADATFGSGSVATYLNGELRPKGVLLAGFSSLGSAGVPDRLAAISGQPPNDQTKTNCTTYSQIPPLTSPDKNGVVALSGCVYPNTIVTLAEQLQGQRLTWKGYAEDLDKGPRGAAATCRRPDPDKLDDTQDPHPGDTYSTRNVPWVYFRSLIDVAGCDTGVVPLSKLSADLAAVKTTPNFTSISPGSCSDGSHGACSDGAPGGFAAADAFLKQVVPGILSSPAYQQDGLLVITFAGGPGSDDAPSKNGTLLLSRYVSAGGSNDTVYNPYSLLRTFEDLFALPKYLAKAQDATSFADDVLAGARPVQPGDD